MTPDDPRHGTRAGYDVHRRAGQKACDPCRTAAAKYEQMRQLDLMANRPRLVDALGVRRRIHALNALGYSNHMIADHIGVSHDRVYSWASQEKITRRSAERLAAAYEALAMKIPNPLTHGQKVAVSRSRNKAKAEGWLPPLAWNDIDDPDETPVRGRDLHDHDDVDPVVVERFLSGEWNIPTTKAEKFEITARWLAWGRSLKELARATGWKAERYVTRQDGAA